MPGGRVVLLLVSCLCGCGVARRAGREDADTLGRVDGARCASRCLALHMTRLSARFAHLQNDDVLVWCENHRRCSQCLNPCKELWGTKRGPSGKTCKKHHECATSVAFLASLQTNKQGDCPPPARASGFAAACVESCTSDYDCTATRKCCSNGCGHTCQAAINLYQGVPLRPKRDLTFVEDPQGRLEISWMSRFNISVEPVLYILQRRWNQGIQPSEDSATVWQTVLMTMENQAVLKDIRPNRWYQFRVSAVNSQGTRGFTEPSRHFFSSQELVPPAKPRNLRRAELREQPGSSVSVLVQWDPPRENEVAVHYYRVSWRAFETQQTDQKQLEQVRVTQGNVCEIELEDLQPDTAYLVQVQAVTYWGQKRLRSSRSQLNFTTALQDAKVTGQRSNELPSGSTYSPSLRLEAAAPHYLSHQLQVKVFWRSLHPEIVKDPSTYLLRWFPEVCAHNKSRTEHRATVQGNHFVINDLFFACKYRVALKLLSGQGQGPETVTSVITPPCGMLMGDVAKSPACAGDEHHPLATKVPLWPEKLTTVFRTVNGSLRGEFSWQLSLGGPGWNPATALRFSLSHLSPDSVPIHIQVLALDQNFLTVENMKPQSIYELQLQVLSAGGSGMSAVKTLHTPPLSDTQL